MFNKILLLAMLLTMPFIGLNAQTKKAFLVAAEQAILESNKHGALVYYNEALKFDEDNPELLFKTAEAATLYNSHGFSSVKLRHLLDTLKSLEYPEAIYLLAKNYQMLGRYQESMRYYDMYLAEYSNQSPKLTEAARIGKASCIKSLIAIKNIDEKSKVTLLGDTVNTVDAEFGGFDRDQKLYYTSMAFPAEGNSTKQMSKILNASAINDLDSKIVLEKSTSTANYAFNHDGTAVYYSVCDYIDGTYIQRCDIYKSKLDAQGMRSDEVKLSINELAYSSTQPSIAYDALSGKEYLYFASNREGGVGEMDIWKCELSGDNYINLENLKDINTGGNELTPFYHSTTNTLYFSTDHREGFGGYDIYKWSSDTRTVINLPSPVNSSINDYYYWVNDYGNSGYLTSNRGGLGAQYENFEPCCLDIYKIDIDNSIILEVATLLRDDRSALAGTKICLYDNLTNKLIECITNPLDKNKQNFKVQPNRSYKLVATKDGYTTATDEFKTGSNDTKIIRELLLNPIVIKLDVFTFLASTKADLTGTEICLYDEDTKQLIKCIKNSELANHQNFELNPNKNYKIIATKNGYTTAMTSFDTNGWEGGTVRKDMYLDLNTILQDLLPISLYFDNDYPDPRSNKPITTSRFMDLANDYYKRRSDYITNYTAPLKAEEKESAQKLIEIFFDNDLKEGKDRLVAFMEALEKNLSSGATIELEVKGYASPRSLAAYNKVLSARRISSIRNELGSYRNGIMNSYLLNNKLSIKYTSYGNERAKPDVVSDINDLRNSIYSLNAARERRVEIVAAKQKL